MSKTEFNKNHLIIDESPYVHYWVLGVYLFLVFIFSLFISKVNNFDEYVLTRWYGFVIYLIVTAIVIVIITQKRYEFPDSKVFVIYLVMIQVLNLSTMIRIEFGFYIYNLSMLIVGIVIISSWGIVFHKLSLNKWPKAAYFILLIQFIWVLNFEHSHITVLQRQPFLVNSPFRILTNGTPGLLYVISCYILVKSLANEKTIPKKSIEKEQSKWF